MPPRRDAAALHRSAALARLSRTLDALPRVATLATSVVAIALCGIAYGAPGPAGVTIVVLASLTVAALLVVVGLYARLLFALGRVSARPLHALGALMDILGALTVAWGALFTGTFLLQVAYPASVGTLWVGDTLSDHADKPLGALLKFVFASVLLTFTSGFPPYKPASLATEALVAVFVVVTGLFFLLLLSTTVDVGLARQRQAMNARLRDEWRALEERLRGPSEGSEGGAAEA